MILILFLLSLCCFNSNNNISHFKNQKPKIAVCLFGVIPRSIKYTWESINNNIIEPLKKEYNVEIYIFNLCTKGRN